MGIWTIVCVPDRRSFDTGNWRCDEQWRLGNGNWLDMMRSADPNCWTVVPGLWLHQGTAVLAQQVFPDLADWVSQTAKLFQVNCRPNPSHVFELGVEPTWHRSAGSILSSVGTCLGELQHFLLGILMLLLLGFLVLLLLGLRRFDDLLGGTRIHEVRQTNRWRRWDNTLWQAAHPVGPSLSQFLKPQSTILW